MKLWIKTAIWGYRWVNNIPPDVIHRGILYCIVFQWKLYENMHASEMGNKQVNFNQLNWWWMKVVPYTRSNLSGHMYNGSVQWPTIAQLNISRIHKLFSTHHLMLCFCVRKSCPAVPERPQNLGVVSTTWESIEVSLQPGFDGGYPQQFIFTVSAAAQNTSPDLESDLLPYNITGVLCIVHATLYLQVCFTGVFL